jgi:hypothetical protein
MGAVAGLLLGGAGVAAAAAPQVSFCDGPVWCDPIHTGMAGRAGDVETASLPSNTVPGERYIGAHRLVSVTINSSFAVSVDALGTPSLGRVDGKAVPLGETVGYIASTSLGAVTRSTTNGGLPHGVQIDDPALNGRPDAVLVAGRLATAGASASALGVWYDGARWWLYNEDGASMAAAETFAYAEGSALGGHVVHTQANDFLGIGVYVDDARVNGKSSAVVIPQHEFGQAVNASALGVWYDAARGQWVVYNENGSALAAGQKIHYVAVP